MTEATDHPVRTRFAPSPTGPLHIGGVRSALFGWLLARHHHGQFILRIEDTDRKRYVPGSTEMIMDVFHWLDIDWDEGPDKGGQYGPYIQSERLELYQKWAKWLVANNKAYYAYDTPEELAKINEERKAKKLPHGYDGRHRNLTELQRKTYEAEGRKPVIRFKSPHKGKTTVEDLVQGTIEFENHTIQDAILLKADGYATYHLAHIVDDHFMKISHVTRAAEWLSSFPLHVQIWQAFGWQLPQFAHLPVLLNPNGKGKLSKRLESFNSDGQKILVLGIEYKEAGYLPEALMNFLTNIGWNFGNEREVFSITEAIERFDITEVNPANSAFPIKKLDWLNGLYIREKLTSEELAKRLRRPLEDAGLEVNTDMLHQVAPLVQNRIKTLNDVVHMAGFFFYEEFKPPTADDLIQRKMDVEGTLKILDLAGEKLSTLDDWTTVNLHKASLPLVGELGLKNGQVFGTMRVAVTGQKVSTPTFETMEILGKEESLQRFRIASSVLR